jgi:hypothetical protein
MYTLTQHGSISRDADGATIPTDLGNRDYQTFLSWVAAGNQPASYTPPSLAPQDYIAAAQHLLDSTVQQRNYDDIAACVTYAGDPDATFNAEGSAAKAWRSQVWRACYERLAAMQSGQTPQLAITDFVASLPKLVW